MGSLERHALARPGEVCLADPARELTWAGWNARANALAAGLHDALGIGAGARVVLHLENSVTWFELSFALAKLGASEIAAAPEWPEAIVAEVAADAGAVAVATADGVGGLPYTELAVAGAPPREAGRAHTAATVAYAVAGDSSFERLERRLDPARVAQAALVIGDLLGRLGAGAAGRHLVAAPLSDGPPAMLAQLTLAAGGSLVLMPAFDPEAALALIDSRAVTATYLGPGMVQAMTALPAIELERWDTSSLDAVVAGEALEPELAIDLFGENCLHTLAGDSRTGPVALLDPAGQREQPASLGRPLAGVHLEPAGDGELALSSPLAADGVSRLRGRLDADGHLWPA